MPRGTSSLKRSPLRTVSKKRSKAQATYTRRRIAFLSERSWCEACLPLGRDRRRVATQVHHMAGRTGKNYLDILTWLPVCGICHTWIHENGAAARQLGLLV